MTNAMTTTNYSAIKKYANSEEIKQIFRGIVGNEHAEGYIYSVIVAVSASDQLQQCTPQSIMRSAARAATLGLSCDPALGQAYLVPFKDEATLIPGWRGIRDMAYRTGQIAKINVGFLAEGQEWVEDQLTGDGHIEGIPKSNKPVGYFAYMKTFSGREHSLYMSNEDIQAHKEKYAKGFNRANSAWNTDFHKMAKKTVLSQLLKQWAPLDPTGAVVANLEYAADGIDEMPDPSEVTIIEGEHRNNKQIMNELGFDTDEVWDDEFTVDEPMTIERAAKITDSKGTPYIEIDSETLSKKTIGISKGLSKPDLTDEKRQFYQEKLDAIKVILQARESGEI
jgi:recombination protein RecT